MLLRNFDVAKKYFDYNRNKEFEDTSNPQIKGWYKYINNVLSALFVKDNQLYFIYGNDTVMISNSHHVLLKTRDNNSYEFTLLDGFEILTQFYYQLPNFSFNFAPFEYLDDEDNSWEEYVAKVINDKQRQVNFVKNLME
ncbi:hypothetical protein ACR79N_00690 [Sphingobacterium siyangense]|jgi:hypothetical protein|uniref:Uncharacterized protein n=1 Tax=Sphingobacterium siyangense TaxID=459529 RepID=A0A562LZJ0_9SPHI|nr:hypothetical protein [Sphingobacterium siyangense]TWI13056.1 hypothetical protein IQ31_05519 [Sphingobacterium siyangense]